MEQHLLLGDSKDVLKTIKDGSIDLLATDPSYGLHFMGKDWDKALPDTEIFRECYRVLKPGAFIAVMSSPRSDLLYRMIQKLEDAGFDMSFSPILWTYHTGFPKASDTSKMIDKRAGAEREVVGEKKSGSTSRAYQSEEQTTAGIHYETTASTDLAKKYEGSKLGFQPKPAVEHIIIGMKPHGQNSYIDNVLNFEALPDNIKMTYPFLQVPKPAKKEKNMGVDKNNHPTTKPVKLMSYIITLFTREGDWVLDPFLGSGTTGVASKLINRNFVGIEREQEYMDIVKERCEVDRDELIKFFKEGK
jgi:site-specific DNA-methyltransferase (adenine-specific)